jgi:hypothetical protein
MSVSAVAGRSARRSGWASAVMAALPLGLGLGIDGCSRHTAPAPAATDGAPARSGQPAVRDAAVDRPVDAPGPPRGPGHRATATPRPPAASGFEVEGGISKADAETVLLGARDKLNACYEQEHAKKASLVGRVTFRLSIDGRGRVPLAEVVSSTLGGGDPERCMMEALRDLRFPPSSTGGESTLTFPVTFGR